MDKERFIDNMYYDESVDVSEPEDVPTAMSVTPRVPLSKNPVTDDDEEDYDEEEEDDDDIQTG